MSTPLLAAALDYAARGWRVVPLRPRDKLPRPRDWPNVATTDPDLVRRWWADVPAGNVGVALGSGSGLVAIDNDSDAGSRMLLDMSEGDLPDTCEMTTGKGSRLMYAIPDLLDFEPKTVATLKDEEGKEALRFQGRGGQCVMPPSVHPSGKLYAWVEGRSPASLDPAPMPAWLIFAMSPREPSHPPTPRWADWVPDRAAPTAGGFNQAADWWADILLPAGFTPSRPPRGDRGSLRFCRPGKDDHSVSATVGYYSAADGTPALFVFSSSIPGLDGNKCYDKFGAFARLFHRGNFSAARAAAVAKGYIRPGRPTPRHANGAGPQAHDGYPDAGQSPEAAASWLDQQGKG